MRSAAYPATGTLTIVHKIEQRLCTGLIAAAMIATLAGCHSTDSGTATTTTASAGNDNVDRALLDPGSYPTEPQPQPRTTGSAAKGALIEGRRMANNVVGPWEVDAKLISGDELVGVLKEPDALNVVLNDGEAVGAAADTHNFVTGFSSSRHDYKGRAKAENEQQSLINIVLRFASPDDAGAAAAEMAANSATVQGFAASEPIETHPIPVPRYPDSSAVTFDALAGAQVLSYTARGTYVLIQQAYSADSPDAAAELVAAALDKQGPLIDQFQPTPVDQLADLPLDPDGLLARTLPPDAETMTVNNGSYLPHGMLHFHADPLRSQTVFDDARLEVVAKGRTNVYQTPDAASAKKVIDGFASIATQEGLGTTKFVAADGIKGMPDSKCFRNDDPNTGDTFFYCLAAADRYAIELSTGQQLSTHQLVSAQYLMLTSK